jgi:hypothetical protein
MASLLPPTALGVLGEGRQAYVAVASTKGPHVTPELYTWSGDRLWFAAASTTLKAKVLRRDPSLGAVVNVAGRSVVLSGEVEVFDPRNPVGVLGRFPELPGVARALTSFTTRNAADLLAFVGDTAAGRLGRKVPPLRLLFALTPQRIALIENDALTGHWGWSVDPTEDDDPVPVGGERAVAAFPGPVALPVRWFADTSRLHLARPLTGLLDRPSVRGTFPISVVVDDYSAPGPAAKRGALVRGEGRAVEGDLCTIEVQAERVVEWDGTETASGKG